MRSTFYGLEIAKTGMFTAQNQLDLTGHNMSNAGTVGYTRQRVVTKAMPPAFGGTFIAVDNKSTAGRGVNTMHIEQVRNPFLDWQYRNENSTTTEWTTKEQYFEYVEAIFNNELEQMDISTGLSQTFAYFYNAMYSLVEGTKDTSARKTVQEAAIQMTDQLNLYYSKLMEQQETLDESIRISVEEINDLADQIALLNGQIYAFEITGARANDLRDQRNVLIDTLSGIVDINAYEDLSGQLVIQVGDRNLVHHTRAKQLAVNDDVPNPIDGEKNLFGVYWADSDGNPTANELKFTSGALKGYVAIRDGDSAENPGIPYVVNQLNEMCRTVAQKINDVHLKGYTMPSTGDNAESRQGILFFHVDEAIDANGDPYFDYSAITAKDFRISNDIRRDPNNIACSDKKVKDPNEANDQTGNAEILHQMCELIYSKDDKTNTENLNGMYRAILSGISVALGQIHTTTNAQSVMRAHLEEQRQSISAVSLDEEMTNIVRFGHSYRAASRMITAIDEELDTLINRMGLVGRS